MSSVAATLPPDVSSVRTCRRLLRDALSAWGATSCAWSAAQVLSELATNAVLHAGTAFTVQVSLGDGVLRLEVTDGSARRPRERHYGTEATTGRGVSLVAALCRAWGVAPHDGGKTVWCEVAVDADANPAEEDDEAGQVLAAWAAVDALDDEPAAPRATGAADGPPRPSSPALALAA